MIASTLRNGPRHRKQSEKNGGMLTRVSVQYSHENGLLWSLHSSAPSTLVMVTPVKGSGITSDPSRSAIVDCLDCL